jgi:DNA-binding CsgD family transcriptional regulator
MCLPFGLTRCQAEVASLAAQGLSNAEIAARLFVSVPTVKTHLTAVFARLGIRRRSQIRERLTAGAGWITEK